MGSIVHSPYAVLGTRQFAVTPSNSVDFTTGPAIVCVMTAGTVEIVSMDGDVVDWVVNTVPFIIPVIAKRVNVTNTTGGINLIGIY
jgi:hypothetical protein